MNTKYFLYARKSTDVEDPPPLKLRTGRQDKSGLLMTNLLSCVR